uniref:Secreted protein n=1 Tax=Peronospora matthiolae TaxID=2874970 RepID=A0AAV1UHM7_9STRA
MWWVFCSICITTLWVQRNRVVHEGHSVTLAGCIHECTVLSFRQLHALALRGRRQLHTQVAGTRLMQCIGLLTMAPYRALHTAVSHVKPPDHPTPALLSWLRSFQTSCTP